jgi:D-ribulokinase
MMALGIDFGTSGARAIALDRDRTIQAQVSLPFPTCADKLAALWQTTLIQIFETLPLTVRQNLGAIAINGTSSTVLLCDAQGLPVTEPLLYSDDRGVVMLEQLRAIAPPQHTVVSATSSLAKLLWWAAQGLSNPAHFFLHQADWLSFLLHGQLGISDYHNALKLGYDVGELRYPDWLTAAVPFHLPAVVSPGAVVGPVTEAIAQRFSLPRACVVCAGTTDSIAAFLASGATQPGEAVTSLGSTLVLKLLSTTRVDDARYGVYSHRLGDSLSERHCPRWLVGGASNTGGAVLRHFFTNAELAELSDRIDPDQPSGLDYYPLLKPGDRFPINDPTLPPRLEPRPADPAAFLHGLLEGIARIEAQGYRLLQELGATPLTQVYTAGGGAQNEVWMRMRSRLLGVPVERFSLGEAKPSRQTEAAYGTALLAYAALVP